MSALARGLVHRYNHERDFIIGTGYDHSTRSYVLTPGPTVRIVKYIPGGVNGNTTINGREHYIRDTVAGAKAAVRTGGQGDWLLFPGDTTLTYLKTSGVNPAVVELANMAGPSAAYPFVFGTYDPTDHTNIAKYNKGYCTIDVNDIPWQVPFCYNLGRSEDYVAITKFKLIGTNHQNSLNSFYSAIGNHSYYLFQDLILDSGAISHQATTAFHDLAIAITSVGTTATISTSGLSAGNQTTIDAQAVGGSLTWFVSGATPSAYNGTYVVTRTSATTYTYTFAGAAGAPATGSPLLSLVMAGVPDSQLNHHIIWNRVHIGNCAPYTTDGITLGSFWAMVKHYRQYDCLFHHNGWHRNSDRTPRRGWTLGTMRACTLAQTGGLATATVSDTTNLVNGGWVFVESGGNPQVQYRLVTQVINVVANTSFQYYVDPTSPATDSGTYCLMPTGVDTTLVSLTSVSTTATATHASAALDTALQQGNVQVSIAGAGQSNYNGTKTVTRTSSTTFTYTITATTSPATGTILARMWDPLLGGSPTIFNHNVYFNEMNDDTKIFRPVFSWDSCNAKMTGGQYYIETATHIREPIGKLFAANGNTTNKGAWPGALNTECRILNDLQVNSADCATDTPRGYATNFAEVGSDSGVSNGLLINADNPNPVNRAGYDGWANSSGLSSFFRMEHCVAANWGPHDDTAALNTTKAFRQNITDDATALTGGTNLRWSDTPVSYQAKRALLMARNVHTTFRLAIPQLSGVSVGATDMDTEQNVVTYMLYHPEIPWAMLLNQHFRSPIGR